MNRTAESALAIHGVAVELIGFPSSVYVHLVLSIRCFVGLPHRSTFSGHVDYRLFVLPCEYICGSMVKYTVGCFFTAVAGVGRELRPGPQSMQGP